MYDLIARGIVIVPIITSLLFGMNQPKKVQNTTVATTEPSSTISAEAEPPSIQDYAKSQIIEKFGLSHWDSFDKLINSESGWNHQAQNSHSTAYGIGQFLNSTWKGTGIEKTDDPYKQVDATIIYIASRYENPNNAWSYWQIHRSY